MTVKQFDISLSRFANLVSIFALLFEACRLIKSYWQGHISLSLLILYVGGIVGLSTLVIYAISRYMARKQKDVLDSAAKRATQVDYKYCSDIAAPGIQNLLCSRYNIDIKNLSSSDPVVIHAAQDGNYLSAEQFFADASIMSSFECVPLKNENKKDKCILQVLYVPIDADGNVPVILRMPDQHSSAGKDEPRFTFVSFSPVPRHYEAKFDKLDCYQREVPLAPTSIDEYGAALSKQGSCYYLFYIFFARYNDLHFAKDGKMDRAVLERVFSVGDGKMFAKDHDEILHVTTFKNLYKAITKQTYNDEMLKQLVKKGKRKFVRLENGKPLVTFSFDLSTARFKGVEEKLVECEGRKAS